LQYNVEAAQLVYQKVLGQVLLYPPNVAGWPGGKNWIDSSTLVARLKLPQTLITQSEFGFTPKDDDDVMMGMADGAASPAKAKNKIKNLIAKAKIGAQINWPIYIDNFAKVERPNLMAAMQNFLIQPLKLQTTLSTVEKFANQNSREEYIKSCTMALMSLPEYQLC
jgi:hypothetical protein